MPRDVVAVSESGLKTRRRPRAAAYARVSGVPDRRAVHDRSRSRRLRAPARRTRVSGRRPKAAGSKLEVIERVMFVKICGDHAARGRGAAVEPARARSGSCSGRTSPRVRRPASRARDRRARCRRSSRRSACSSISRSTTSAASRPRPLGAVQLHGDETPAFAASIGVPGHQGACRGRRGRPRARGRRGTTLLLDAHDPVQRGGTGRTIDWWPRRRSRRRGACCWPAGSRPTTWPRRLRACGRSASTCRRASSARRASRIIGASARSSRLVHGTGHIATRS